MKSIRRLDVASPGLARYRATHPASRDWNDFRSAFESGDAYKELIGSLTAIQHSLCAYCEIDLADTDRQIEHFHPKSDTTSFRNWTFEPTNLLAACKGGSNPHSGEPARRALRPSGRSRSCGEAKGGKALDGTDPRYPKILKATELPAFPSLFEVLYDGRIRHDAAACAQAGVPVEEACATVTELNLDCERLRGARRAVWDELSKSLEHEGGDDAAYLSALESMAEEFLLPNASGRLGRFFTTMRSFFGVVGEDVLRRAGASWV